MQLERTVKIGHASWSCATGLENIEASNGAKQPSNQHHANNGDGAYTQNPTTLRIESLKNGARCGVLVDGSG